LTECSNMQKELFYQSKKYEEKVLELKGLEKGSVSIGIAHLYYFDLLCPVFKRSSKYVFVLQHSNSIPVSKLRTDMCFRISDFHFHHL